MIDSATTSGTDTDLNAANPRDRGIGVGISKNRWPSLRRGDFSRACTKSGQNAGKGL